MNVFKNKLEYNPVGETTIYTSCHGGLLNICKQNNEAVVYYEIDPDADREFPIHIRQVLTGHEFVLDNSWKYITTLMFDNDQFVVHYYARGYFSERR